MLFWSKFQVNLTGTYRDTKEGGSLKNTEQVWRIRNKSEEYGTSLKNTEQVWRIRNKSEEYGTSLKNTEQVWRIRNKSEQYGTSLNNTKQVWTETLRTLAEGEPGAPVLISTRYRKHSKPTRAAQVVEEITWDSHY